MVPHNLVLTAESKANKKNNVANLKRNVKKGTVGFLSRFKSVKTHSNIVKANTPMSPSAAPARCSHTIVHDSVPILPCPKAQLKNGEHLSFQSAKQSACKNLKNGDEAPQKRVKMGAGYLGPKKCFEKGLSHRTLAKLLGQLWKEHWVLVQFVFWHWDFRVDYVSNRLLLFLLAGWTPADATIPHIPFATKWHKWVCRHLPWGILFGNPESTVIECNENYLGSAICSDRTQAEAKQTAVKIRLETLEV